jgi:hypothetical protein
MGNLLDGEWHWDIRWRREHSVWEMELPQALLVVVANHHLLGAIDFWSWRHDSTGTFSVKSAYLLLTASVVPNVLGSLLARVWKSSAPSKVIFFFGNYFSRVPTMQNLLKRGVIRDPDDALCAFCGASIEPVDHLLVTCVSTSLVWYFIFRWLIFRFVSHKLRWLLIWHATV